MEAMNRLKPALIVLRTAYIAVYLGNTGDLWSNISGVTDDFVQFYRLVIRSGTWQRGLDFGQFTPYATLGPATALAEKKSYYF
jgi:hypothetical protein